MKLALAAGCATLLLAACAPVQYTKADIDGRVVCNEDLMERVEREARRNATTVQWVNCPRATLRVI